MRNFYKLVFLILFTFKVGGYVQSHELEIEPLPLHSPKVSHKSGVIEIRGQKFDLETATFIDYGAVLARVEADIEAKQLPSFIQIPRNCGHTSPTRYTFDQLISMALRNAETKFPAGWLGALLSRLYVIVDGTPIANTEIRSTLKRLVNETAGVHEG